MQHPFIESELAEQFLKRLPSAMTLGDSSVERVLLAEYGAVFVARGVTPPPVIVFEDGSAVKAFQSSLATRTARIGEHEFTLQRPAMDALVEAAGEARSRGLSITPRGADSGQRSYYMTVELWQSRVEPGLDHWTRQGGLSAEQAELIRRLSPHEQVEPIFELERQGIFFAKDLSKPIIYSVAPPGASQHLSLLAFDVREFDDPAVRAILNSHGWFQTVTSDLPHFTYLGMAESELSDAGLTKVGSDGRDFWVPRRASASIDEYRDR
ncbi:MAG: hypothetical protein ACK4S4_09410 [Pyrinomonadaceae bacterium]